MTIRTSSNSSTPSYLDLLEQCKELRERAEKAEAACREHELYASEIVSDAIDPSVNVNWMRFSPELPSYVRKLEACAAEMREWIDATWANRSCFKEPPSTDCGKGWLSPEQAKELQEHNAALGVQHMNHCNKIKLLVEALEVWKTVIALTPIPPRAITYEQGWRILDAVQEAVPMFNKAIGSVKGEQS